jgi:hypothetical protein
MRCVDVFNMIGGLLANVLHAELLLNSLPYMEK